MASRRARRLSQEWFADDLLIKGFNELQTGQLSALRRFAIDVVDDKTLAPVVLPENTDGRSSLERFMQLAQVQLNAFGGAPTFRPWGDVLYAWGWIDLGAPRDFIAWITVGYVNGLDTSPWDFDNGFAVQIHWIDWRDTALTATGGKLDPLHLGAGYRQMAVAGTGQHIAFLLQVFQPEEMEVAAQGLVLYDF